MEQLKYTAFVVTLLLTVPSQAQHCGYRYPDSALFKLKTPVYVGISGGLINNHVFGSEVDFQKRLSDNALSPVSRPAFSVFVKQEIRPYLYVKWGFSHLQKGIGSGKNPTWDLNMKYLSVPLRIGYQPINFNNFSRNLQLGLELGVSVDTEIGHGSDHLKRAYSLDDTAIVTSDNFSALAGINIEFRIFPRLLVFGNYTYYRDFRKLFYRYDRTNGMDFEARQHGSMITGGVMFLLNKSVQ